MSNTERYFDSRADAARFQADLGERLGLPIAPLDRRGRPLPGGRGTVTTEATAPADPDNVAPGETGLALDPRDATRELLARGDLQSGDDGLALDGDALALGGFTIGF